jgi:hypothetical protein
LAWTDYFVGTLPNGKTVASPEGRPYVSMEIAPREYVEVHLTTSEKNCHRDTQHFDVALTIFET